MNAESVLEERAAKLRDAAWKAERAVSGVNDIEALRLAGEELVRFALALAAAPPQEQTLAAWSADLSWIPMEGRTPTLADVAAGFVTSAARVNRNIAFYRDGGGEGRPEDERMLGRLKVDRSAGAAGTQKEAREAAIRAAEKDALALRAAEAKAAASAPSAEKPAKDVVGTVVVRTVMAGVGA